MSGMSSLTDQSLLDQQSHDRRDSLWQARILFKIDSVDFCKRCRVRMSKTSKGSVVRLPLITKPKMSQSLQLRSRDDQLQNMLELESDKAQVEKLDHWTARDYESIKIKKPRMLNSTLYKRESLYRQVYNKKKRTVELSDEGWFMEPKLYLLRLDKELNKVYQINYNSMYKNIQYCSGFYQHFYGDILKALDKYLSSLTAKCQEIEQSLAKKRADHIKALEKSQSTNSLNKLNLSQTIENIENMEAEQEKIKNLVEQIELAKIGVYKHSLHIGYDVRAEGLIWIVRELGTFPINNDFPPFLNEKEINYIRKQFEKQIKAKELQETLLYQDLGKTNDEICEIVARKKKRELSMIRQEDVLKQLQIDHYANFDSEKHKYINEGILKMAGEAFPMTKSTKYQIIYKQTQKKLNKYCVNEIYKKSRPLKKQKTIIESKRQSLSTLKILSHFEAKIEEHLRQANTNQQLQSEEEKELDEIVRSLRYQSYQQSGKIDRSRNAISILCCLLGQQKAKRVVEQELNHLL